MLLLLSHIHNAISRVFRIFHASLKIILKNLTVFRIFARWRVKEGKAKKKKKKHKVIHSFIKILFLQKRWPLNGKNFRRSRYLSRAIRMHDLHTNIHISFIACAAGSNVRVNPLDSRGSSKVTWKKVSAHFNFVVSGRHVAKLAQK